MDKDELIEVDDSELAMGDHNLRLDLPSEIEKKTETVIKEVPIETDVNNEDLFDTDTLLNEVEDNEEEVEVKTPKNKSKEVISEETTGFKADEANEFSVFTSLLNDKGFFPDLEDEKLAGIKSEEDLQEVLAEQLNVTFSQWQENYKQNLVNNLIKEGYVSKDSVKQDLISSFTKDDIRGSADLAKQVHYEFYKEKGLPDKQISRIIAGIEDLEESAMELYDENEANKKVKQLAIAAKMKEQEEQSLKQRENFTEELRKNTFGYEEFIPGRKLQKKDKEEVFLNIEPTLVKINQNLSKYAPILSLLDKYGMLEGNFDKVIKEGKTQSVSQLQQILMDKKKNTNGSSGYSERRTGVINIDDSTTRQIYKK